MNDLNFSVNLNPAYGQYELYVVVKNGEFRGMALGPIVFTNTEPGTYTEPLMRMEPTEAQRLMDALWNAGLRPANGEGSIGQIGAMQKHMDDMRAIAAKSLGVTL